MFADTIDAMTTVRPYRGALPEGVVRAELVKKRGTQFDPTITDVLLSIPVWEQFFAPSHSASGVRSLSFGRGLVERISGEHAAHG